MNDRLKYLWRSVCCTLRRDRFRCPNCDEQRSLLVKRKYFVTALRRCSKCRLLFRVPTDPPGFGDEFYQSEYQSGFTTDCPDTASLRQFLANGFRGTTKDFSSRIALLRALGVEPGSRVLDYGASWGYATWQFNETGYKTVGFELSRQRARFARDMLSVDVRERLDEVEGPFDVFFSCHVIEHVPQVSQVFEIANRLLRPGGIFVAITPNGCFEAMAVEPNSYHRAWGSVHPQYLDAEFYKQAFPTRPTCLASSPFDIDTIRNWQRNDNYCGELSGPELLFAVVPQPLNAGDAN